MDGPEAARHDRPMVERSFRDRAAALGRPQARTPMVPAVPYDRLRDRQRRRPQR